MYRHTHTHTHTPRTYTRIFRQAYLKRRKSTSAQMHRSTLKQRQFLTMPLYEKIDVTRRLPEEHRLRPPVHGIQALVGGVRLRLHAISTTRALWKHVLTGLVCESALSRGRGLGFIHAIRGSGAVASPRDCQKIYSRIPGPFVVLHHDR
jgi:hypothetical protein